METSLNLPLAYSEVERQHKACGDLEGVLNGWLSGDEVKEAEYELSAVIDSYRKTFKEVHLAQTESVRRELILNSNLAALFLDQKIAKIVVEAGPEDALIQVLERDIEDGSGHLAIGLVGSGRDCLSENLLTKVAQVASGKKDFRGRGRLLEVLLGCPTLSNEAKIPLTFEMRGKDVTLRGAIRKGLVFSPDFCHEFNKIIFHAQLEDYFHAVGAPMDVINCIHDWHGSTAELVESSSTLGK